MAALEFTTAITAKQAEKAADAEQLDIIINDETYPARRPDETQIGMFLALFEGATKYSEQLSAVRMFLESFFTEEAYGRIMRQLLNPKHPLRLEDVNDVILGVIQWVSANPTQSSSASTPSQRSTGRSSTAGARSKGQTRSTSPRAGSAARS